MSMQELPDDRLDELFRKSSEEFEPEFNPKAWEAMRRKLDDNDDKTGAWWWRRAGAVMGGLVLASLIGFMFWPESKVNKVSTPPSQVQVGKSNVPTSTPQTGASSQVAGGKEPAKNESSTAVGEDKLASVEAPKTSKALEATPENAAKGAVPTKATKTPSSKRSKINQEIISSEINQLTQTEKNNSGVTSDVIDAKKTPKKERNSTRASLVRVDRLDRKVVLLDNAARQSSHRSEPKKLEKEKSILAYAPSNNTPKKEDNHSEAGNESRQTVSENGVTTPENTPQWPVKMNVTLRELMAKNWKLLDVVVANPTVEYWPPAPPPVVKKKVEEETPYIFQQGFSSRIMAGPDLSFISPSEMLKNPRLALSMMLEYRFAKRWSVQVGAIRSAKVYTATGEQYQWPEIWNSQKVRPTSVDANCKVLDIPINVRYDVIQSRRSRWFIASGISSYKMLNERYDYTYPAHSYPKWWNWEGSTGNYWFGVINASVGVEYQLGRNFSLQAEPFWKLPMADVGFGKIRLQTSGVFISAKYRLGKL